MFWVNSHNKMVYGLSIWKTLIWSLHSNTWNTEYGRDLFIIWLWQIYICGPSSSKNTHKYWVNKMTINHVLLTYSGNYPPNNILSLPIYFICNCLVLLHVLLIKHLLPMNTSGDFTWNKDISYNDPILNKEAVAALGTCKLRC